MAEQTPNRREVLDACAGVILPRYIETWMRSKNSLLGGESPDDLIERGEADKVLALLEGLAEGMVL